MRANLGGINLTVAAFSTDVKRPLSEVIIDEHTQFDPQINELLGRSTDNAASAEDEQDS